MKEFKATKQTGPELESTGKKLESDDGNKNMSPAKSFARALTSKAQLSNAEAAGIINSVINKKIDDDDNYDSSKY